MNHCIRYALKHGVSELHLCIRRWTEMRCPSRIFTSTTLVKLSLGSSLYIEFPSDTSLPSLKVLLLNGICVKPGQLSDVLLPACPVLEDLTIHYGGDYQTDLEYLISKTITNIYYSGRPLFTYYQFDLLVKATLDLRFYYPSLEQNVGKLISGICNVKTLHLTVSSVEIISECCKDELPVFNNLVDLVFSSYRQGWIVLLPRLLKCSPNLKVLVLSGLHRYRFKLGQFVGIQVPFENKIKMLIIKQYRGSAKELKHISHLLLNMKHLKVVKVYVAFRMDEPERMQLTKNLIKLPAASCELNIQVM